MTLQVKHVSKSYQQGSASIAVLRDLNLQVEAGETVAIIGQSGSGKSTLLSLLAGLDDPDSGEIIIAGENLNHKSIEEKTHFRGEHIGIVFQQFHLIPHLTALENITLPLEILGRAADVSLARELLEKVGLSHRSMHYPPQMSGGENQRVALARALITEPDLLLADEPSGNLDQSTGEKVTQLLFDLVKGEKRTLILVTHNSELAMKCDRQLRLVDGGLTDVR